MPRAQPAPPPRMLVVMGVSSSGKSTVGEALAQALGVPFLDADQYHPEANVVKMRAGTALTDDDRWPWLARYGAALAKAAHSAGAVVGACSALRRAYRDYLTDQAGLPILFVHLDNDPARIRARIAQREHAYMPASLLESQLATLEVPGPDENALIVRNDIPVPDVVAQILREAGCAAVAAAGRGAPTSA